MKDPIDHVLMFVQPWVYGDDLVYLIHRELKISQREILAQLDERGRLYPEDNRRSRIVTRLPAQAWRASL